MFFPEIAMIQIAPPLEGGIVRKIILFGDRGKKLLEN